MFATADVTKCNAKAARHDLQKSCVVPPVFSAFFRHATFEQQTLSIIDAYLQGDVKSVIFNDSESINE
jgi:hypothetical protein